MGKAAINDSESVKKFCDELADTVESLEEQLRKTEQAMEDVYEGWKDEKFQKYKQEFNKDKDEIKPLCKDLMEYESDVLYPIYKILKEYEEQ